MSSRQKEDGKKGMQGDGGWSAALHLCTREGVPEEAASCKQGHPLATASPTHPPEATVQRSQPMVSTLPLAKRTTGRFWLSLQEGWRGGGAGAIDGDVLVVMQPPLPQGTPPAQRAAPSFHSRAQSGIGFTAATAPT